jgi:RimJ/RimL family protein N-acetyltransferase
MTDEPTPPKPGGSGAARRRGRPGGTQAERAYGVLEGELHALERDIETAREKSHIAVGGLTLSARPVRPHVRLEGETVELPDGARVVVRPIEPDDAQELENALKRLGALSRYEQFRSDHYIPDRRQLAAETHADHVAHEVLVALDPVTGDGVGLARYVRDRDDPTQAEVAFAVADRWQERGVGTALVQRLARRARDSGIERVRARMLLGNERARHCVARVADIDGETRDGGIVDITGVLR